MTTLLVISVLRVLASVAEMQDEPEVRQLVTFELLPGKTEDVVAMFREEALPLYEANEPMLRFRGFREAESPAPADLVVVSTFRGLAGMDASNHDLRETARKEGTSVGEVYGRIAQLSTRHRDELVEIDPALSWGDTDAAPLIVVTSIRLVPGKSISYELFARQHLVPWEKELGAGITGSDGGRYLLANGWSHVRIIGISSLGDWHHYLRERRAQMWSLHLEGMVAESRQMILAVVPELSVR